MNHWRRAVLAVLVAGSMALGGSALANGQSEGHRQDGETPAEPTAPPESDPTCEHADCAGNNGSETGEDAVCAADAVDLAYDILEEEDGGEACE